MTQKEYNQTVDLFSDNVYRFILKNIKNEAQAKDIVQEAWEKLWINRDELAFEKAKSWLFTTAYRIMIDQIRRGKRVSDYDDEVAERIMVTEGQQYSGLNEVLEQALNRLPEIQKQVLLLRDYEGYDYREIGEITNLSESQVKVYIFRARKAMKKYLVSMEVVI